jgi:cytochrome P450
MTTTAFHFDPRSPEFRRNPYPTYDLLRTHAPIFYWEPWGFTFLSRHEDCTELLRDNRLGRGGYGEPPPDQVALSRK